MVLIEDSSVTMTTTHNQLLHVSSYFKVSRLV